VPDALLVYRKSELEVTVGVYWPRCRCFTTAFRATHPEVAAGGRYSLRVQQLVVDAVVHDKMTYQAVQEKLEREFHLRLSLDTLFQWVNRAADGIDLARDYSPWVLAQASGTVAVDEVYEPCAGVVFLTDPVKHLTLDFHVTKEVTKQDIDSFLQTQKARGLQVDVAITDGSPLSPEPLKKLARPPAPSLCLLLPPGGEPGGDAGLLGGLPAGAQVVTAPAWAA